MLSPKVQGATYASLPSPFIFCAAFNRLLVEVYADDISCRNERILETYTPYSNQLTRLLKV